MPQQQTDHRDYLTDEPTEAGYPRNEIDIELREGRTRHLYVRADELPDPHEAVDTLAQAVQSYLDEHDDVLQAVIYVVEGPDERVPQRTIQG